MRLAVVTSQFPIEGDSTRGRPVLQTIEALSRYVPLEIFVPNARYPKWMSPRSYRYVPPRSESGNLNGAVVHHLGYSTLPLVGRGLNGYLVGRVLSRPVRGYSPDLILAYWLYPDAFGAAEVAGRLGVPLISGARGSDIRARDSLSLALTARALKKSAHVLTVSENLRRIALEKFGLRPDCVSTVTNGCDAEIFRPGSKNEARSRLGLPRTEPLVLFVGRLVAAKGLRELFSAWIALNNRRSPVHLAVLGDGSLRAELVESARASGLSERVHLPGLQPPEAVASWMQACDVLCLPSYTEGYPNVLVEALACGRPVVATPVGGVVEILDDSCGVLASVRDVPSLTEALSVALSREWDAAALSARFRRSWDDVARETLAVCERVLHAR